MNATELYKAGKLKDAIDAQIQEVKASPADQGKRLFLFELLTFAGDLDRARKQIDAVNYAEMELAAAVAGYRRLLDSELARRQLFKDGVVPRFFGEQPEHVHLRLNAVQLLRENRPAEAAQFLAQANAAMPPVRGKVNDRPFDTFRDADDLFAGVLEVMAQGAYYWVPLELVEGLSMSAPKFPRDLIWVPARMDLRDGSSGPVHLAARYPGSDEHADDQVKLGRVTDWKVLDGGPTLGVGTHLYLAGDEDISILEWRHLDMDEEPKQS